MEDNSSQTSKAKFLCPIESGSKQLTTGHSTENQWQPGTQPQLIYLQHNEGPREYCRRGGKILRKHEGGCEIMSPRNVREATPMKSQQPGLLKQVQR